MQQVADQDAAAGGIEGRAHDHADGEHHQGEHQHAIATRMAALHHEVGAVEGAPDQGQQQIGLQWPQAGLQLRQRVAAPGQFLGIEQQVDAEDLGYAQQGGAVQRERRQTAVDQRSSIGRCDADQARQREHAEEPAKADAPADQAAKQLAQPLAAVIECGREQGRDQGAEEHQRLQGRQRVQHGLPRGRRIGIEPARQHHRGGAEPGQRKGQDEESAEADALPALGGIDTDDGVVDRVHAGRLLLRSGQGAAATMGCRPATRNRTADLRARATSH